MLGVVVSSAGLHVNNDSCLDNVSPATFFQIFSVIVDMFKFRTCCGIFGGLCNPIPRVEMHDLILRDN